MENKYYDWLVGDKKHFPKMELPRVSEPQIFGNLSAVKTADEEAEIDEGGEELEEDIRDKEIEADSIRDAMEDSK